MLYIFDFCFISLAAFGEKCTCIGFVSILRSVYIHRSRLLLNINAAGQVGNGIYSKCLAKRQHAASVAYIRCLKNPDDNARHASRPHKRHLDLFRRFCVAHQCDQHRDTHETTPYHDTRSNSAHLENMIRAVVKVVMCSRGGGSASEVETHKNIDSVLHIKTTFQAHSIFSVSIQK